MIENYCIAGLPIKVNGLGVIIPLTIEEMFLMGITEKEIIQPFFLHLDMLLKEEDKQLKEVLKNFDLFFISQNDLLDSLLKSLEILYRTKDVALSEDVLLEQKKIIIDGTIVIDRHNYDSLTDIVLEMFCTQRPKNEEEKVNLPTEKHKKIWEKMQKKKRKKALENQMALCDIINVVCHANGFIPYREVVKLTYYQLITSYKTITAMETYREFTQFKLSPKFDVQKDMKHWMNLAKVSKVPLVD